MWGVLRLLIKKLNKNILGFFIFYIYMVIGNEKIDYFFILYI